MLARAAPPPPPPSCRVLRVGVPRATAHDRTTPKQAAIELRGEHDATLPDSWTALQRAASAWPGGSCFKSADGRELANLMRGASCCCNFWPRPLRPPEHACTGGSVSGPCAARLPVRGEAGTWLVQPRSPGRRCGRFAVSMSGEVRDWHRTSPSFERHVVQGGSTSADVEVYAFLADAAPLHQDGSARGAAFRSLLAAPYLAAATLESSRVRWADGCASAPSAAAFAAELQHRFSGPAMLPRWRGNYSAFAADLLPQARRVQLAFAMVLAAPCAYELVLRARPDAAWHAPVGWARFAAQAAASSGAQKNGTTTLTIFDEEAASDLWGEHAVRRGGIPAAAFCWARDIAAIGPPRAMAGFATLYGDAAYGSFLRSLYLP